ncbi:MAG TPA: sensor histidine kinase [Pseudonocardiaceae bacterium]|nr:sensor histidine kinase [Pseudonocardiaceae bacterium]
MRAATVADVIEPGRPAADVLSPWFRARPWLLTVIDLVAAAWITVLTVTTTLQIARGLSGGVAVVVLLVAFAVGAPLALRRHRPVPVLSVVSAAAVLAMLLGMSVTSTGLAVAVALYPVALSERPRASAIALGVVLMGVTAAAVLAATVLNPHFLFITPSTNSVNTDLPTTLSISWFAIGAGWTLGRSARARREAADRLAEHRAQQAVAEERLRIAREMHDVVAHSMSVIVMKAAVANHVYDTRPEESREALGVIESVSRTALTDIQGVLGSLRATGEAHLGPNPGLDELPTLVENARLADVQVELDQGAIPELPAAVQLSAYRIVQEALTNVIKHALAPVRCIVRITAQDGELHLAVTDDGVPRRPASEGGQGLIGMRERAALHHGTLEAGQRPGGGFAVHARLPFESRAAQ